jgi:hypothetical protein
MVKAFLAPMMRGTLLLALISRAPETPRNLVRYRPDEACYWDRALCVVIKVLVLIGNHSIDRVKARSVQIPAWSLYDVQ